MPFFLGIDLGTSSVKALLLDSESGNIFTEAEDYDVDIPQINRAEQNPDVWWKQTCSAVRKVLRGSGVDPALIMALSFSGQMHGLVTLDKDNHIVHPAIIWSDARCADIIKDIYSKFGGDFIKKNVQNKIASGFLLPSLCWLKLNEEGAYRRTAAVMLPKDYIKYKLCGNICTDYSDAAATLAFDNIRLRWSQPLLGALDIDENIFPRCLPSLEQAGEVTRAASEECGLKKGTSVISGGADQCMQGIGNGIISGGVFSCNTGTGAQISTCVPEPVFDTEGRVSTFAHVIPGRWNVQGSVLSAGAALKWLASSVIGFSDYKALDAGAAKTRPGADGLLFLPYLAGERTPVMDSTARGIFFGLGFGHNRFHLARAVMEGVAFALRDCLDLIVSGMGIRMEKIIASGGGAKSPLWLQIQADILETPLARTKTAEQAALGAAINAAVAARAFNSYGEACGKLVQTEDKICEPHKEYASLYREKKEIYNALYRQNKALFRDNASWT